MYRKYGILKMQEQFLMVCTGSTVSYPEYNMGRSTLMVCTGKVNSTLKLKGLQKD